MPFSKTRRTNSVMKSTRIPAIIRAIMLIGAGLAIPAYADVLTDFITTSNPSATNTFLGTVIVGGGSGASNNEVLHWTMNDNTATPTVLDALGTANGTAQQNTSALSVTGKLSKALYFNGSSDYVSTTLPIGTANAITLAFWANIADTSVADYLYTYICIFSLTDDYLGESTTFQGTIGGWGYQGLMSVPGPAYSPYAYETGYLPPTNTWVHYAFVYDGTYSYVYVNGNLVSQTDNGSGSFGGSSAFVPRYLFIGGDFPQCWGTGFKGMIDDVRYYAQVLNASQISALYNSGVGTEADSFAPGGRGSLAIDSRGGITLNGAASIGGASNGTWHVDAGGNASFSSLSGITAAQVGAVGTNDARYLAALTNAAAFDPSGVAASINLNSLGGCLPPSTNYIAYNSTNNLCRYAGAEAQEYWTNGTINNNFATTNFTGWTLYQCRTLPTSSFRTPTLANSGSYLFRLENTNNAAITSPVLTQGIGSISFVAGVRYAGNGICSTNYAQLSFDNGTTWTNIGVYAFNETGGSVGGDDINPTIVVNTRRPVVFRFIQLKPANVSQNCAIDNIIITYPGYIEIGGDGSTLSGITAAQVGAVPTNDLRFLAALTNSAQFATAAQGTLASTALQPTGNGSQLIGLTVTQVSGALSVSGSANSLSGCPSGADTLGAATTALNAATNAISQFLLNVGPSGDLSMGSYTNRGQ